MIRRTDIDATCAGKRSYPDRQAARTAANTMRDAAGKKARLSVYSCPYAGIDRPCHWHVGHESRATAKRAHGKGRRDYSYA